MVASGTVKKGNYTADIDYKYRDKESSRYPIIEF